MNKRLVTCPVCNTDQHVYRDAICNHDNGTLRCVGSRTPLIGDRAARTFNQTIFEKKQDGITHKGFIANQRFYITTAQVEVGKRYEIQERPRGGFILNLGGTKVEVTQSFVV